MIFKKLELENFKSHQHNTIDFKPGITIIIGENGAGKSTIFEAISFALYKKYTGDKINNLIRKNSTKPMLVKLTFTANGTTYRITRKRTQKQSKAKLEKQENTKFITIAENDKTVNQQIQEILNMDADLFLNSTYVRQGEITDLISKTPGERKALIGKLLKLEELEKAFKNSLSLINEYKYNQAEIKGKITQEPLNEQLKNNIIEYNKLKKQYKKTEEQKKELLKQQNENDKQKNEMEQLKKEYEKYMIDIEKEEIILNRLKKEQEELQNEINKFNIIEEKIKELKPFIKQLPEYLEMKDLIDQKENLDMYTDQKNQLQEKYEELQTLQEETETLESEKTLLNEDIQSLEKIAQEKRWKQEQNVNNKKMLSNTLVNSSIQSMDELNDFEKDAAVRLNSLLEQLIESSTELKELKQERDQLKAQNDSMMDLLIQTEQVDQKCPVCMSDISKEKKNELIEYYNEKIQKNYDSLDELKYKIDDVSEINDKLSVQVENLKNVRKDIPQYRYLLDNILKNEYSIQNLEDSLSDFNTKKEKYENINRQINLNNSKIDSLQKDYHEYIKIKSIIETLPTQQEIQNKINKLNIEQDNINLKIQDLQQKEQEYNQLLGSIQNKNATIEKNNTTLMEINTKNDKIKNLKKQIESSTYDDQKYLKIKEQAEQLNNNITSVSISLKEYDIKITDLHEKIDNSILLIRNQKKYQNEYLSLDDYIILLDNLRYLYSKDGIQKTLRSLSRPMIQEYTKRFFEKFDFNYSNLVLDDEYNISLYGPEGEARLDMISGGEKIAVALALRLGIAEAVAKSNVETILLDEPTIHLDVQRIDELAALLRELSTIPQMIIVTHDVELESAADNIIKVSKENGISII